MARRQYNSRNCSLLYDCSQLDFLISETQRKASQNESLGAQERSRLNNAGRLVQVLVSMMYMILQMDLTSELSVRSVGELSNDFR